MPMGNAEKGNAVWRKEGTTRRLEARAGNRGKIAKEERSVKTGGDVSRSCYRQ